MKTIFFILLFIFLVACEEKTEEPVINDDRTEEEREKDQSDWERKTEDRLKPSKHPGFRFH